MTLLFGEKQHVLQGLECLLKKLFKKMNVQKAEKVNMYKKDVLSNISAKSYQQNIQSV